MFHTAAGSLLERAGVAALALHGGLRGAGPIPKVSPTEPPGGAKVLMVVGWLGWGMFLACVAGVFAIVIKMATASHRSRGGEGGADEAGKLFWPLLGCIVGSSAGALLGVVS